MAETVLIQKEKFYYTVRLNRPEKHNAFNPEMIGELTKFFEEVSNDKFAGAILLTGAGTSFCAGGDINWMKSIANYNLQQNMADATALFRMYEAAANCAMPIIGYLHGNVYGGGVGLAAICDIAIAETSTRFCFSEVRLGLVPAVISSFAMKKMALNKAREHMLTGEPFGTDEALQAGLIEHICRELEAKEFIKKTLNAIGKNGPEAVRETKWLINFNRVSRPEEIKTECIEVIAERRVSAEGQEGLKSFLEKRKPAWVWHMTEDET
jgi:methylglutaconyl-CoA hydratase